ncbi:MAG: hypothetical protein KBT30_00985 [Clostridiales bacterium]|nr:hypothetical protein [Candidatus Apopatousia equi]
MEEKKKVRQDDDFLDSWREDTYLHVYPGSCEEEDPFVRTIREYEEEQEEKKKQEEK